LNEPHAERNAALDGLRGVAVLVVLLCHISPYRLAGGNIGVDLFFVLSDFLITSILLNEHRSTGTISIKLFYLRRALRLFPALFSVIVFAVVYTWLVPPEQAGETLKGTLSDAFYVATYIWNLRLIWMRWHDLGGGNGMLSHLWSLSVEEQFYIIWAALLLLVLNLRASRPALLAIFAIGILGPAIARLAMWKSGPSITMYFASPLRVDGLMWGALLASLLHINAIPTSSRFRSLINILAVVSIAVFLIMSKDDYLSGGELYQWGFSLVGAMSVVMILSATTNPKSTFTKCLEWRWLQYTGKISYGLYLWHIPILSVHHHLSAVTHGVVGLTATYVTAVLSFRYWESPWLRLKTRIGYPRSVSHGLPVLNDLSDVPSATPAAGFCQR
jgi:peptidoglycan/LPS O-acetylase OafA/YrhL